MGKKSHRRLILAKEGLQLVVGLVAGAITWLCTDRLLLGALLAFMSSETTKYASNYLVSMHLEKRLRWFMFPIAITLALIATAIEVFIITLAYALFGLIFMGIVLLFLTILFIAFMIRRLSAPQ